MSAGEDQLSSNTKDANPISRTPSVQGNRILPGSAEASPVITATNYNYAAGAMSEQSGQDLHGILEAFDPLSVKSPPADDAPSAVKATDRSKQPDLDPSSSDDDGMCFA